MTISIGSDPEAFIKNAKTGEIISSIPIVKNTKDNPINLKDGYHFYCDCVAVEGTIPPAKNKDEFIHNVLTLFDKIKVYIGGAYDISYKASYIFPKKHLQDEGANEIGCNPFFLSHTMEQAEPPFFTDGIRAAGFHIHIGRNDFKDYEPNQDGIFLLDPYSKINLINNMDLFVGIPSMVFDNGEDSRFRKKLYTQLAGAHRPTPYGAEYRPLSASCMRSPELLALIYDLTMLAVEATAENKTFDVRDEEIFECIDKSNEDLSRKVMERYLPSDFIQRIKSFSSEK